MTIFALVDCDSFYVSCERAFRPALQKVPVIVLSNNDGCTISRSDEAKALGIKMGTPYHHMKELIRREGVRVFSSNYALYGDMSARVMTILEAWTPDLEIYSIDEAFLRLDGAPARDALDYARRIRSAVRQELGIPTCIGLGPTKVLAKVANKIAKRGKSEPGGGVYSLCDEGLRAEVLAIFPAADLWGIGGRSAEKLKSYGIQTAAQLRDADPDLVQRLLTVVGRRIQMELHGHSCLLLEMVAPNKKQIICSRSFGRPVFSFSDLMEAVAQYTTRAAEKLRRQQSVCHVLTVWVHTNPFKAVRQYYSPPATVRFLTGTASTTDLIREAERALRGIYREGIEYKKAIVMLGDIRPDRQIQFGLFDDRERYERERNTMRLMDQINARMGRDMIRPAACGTDQGWKMASKLCSPCYTTRWADIPKVRC